VSSAKRFLSKKSPLSVEQRFPPFPSAKTILLYLFVILVCGIIRLWVNAYLSEVLLVVFVGVERYGMGMSKGYQMGYDAAHAMYKRGPRAPRKPKGEVVNG